MIERFDSFMWFYMQRVNELLHHKLSRLFVSHFAKLIFTISPCNLLRLCNWSAAFKKMIIVKILSETLLLTLPLFIESIIKTTGGVTIWCPLCLKTRNWLENYLLMYVRNLYFFSYTHFYQGVNKFQKNIILAVGSAIDKSNLE